MADTSEQMSWRTGMSNKDVVVGATQFPTGCVSRVRAAGSCWRGRKRP